MNKHRISRITATIGAFIGVGIFWILTGAITEVLVYRVILLFLGGALSFNIAGLITLILTELFISFWSEPEWEKPPDKWEEVDND